MSELQYKASNNKYKDCPPRMSDGRHFTDYRPNDHLNNLIKANNNLKNSFDFRNHLTNNAEKLINLNREYIQDKNGCAPCMKPYHQGTMLPESSKVECNSDSCNVTVTNKEGLGQGRNYGTPKEDY